MFSFDMADLCSSPFSPKPSFSSEAYTPTDVYLLCSKVDLMEEDHSHLALVPMQNPVREAEFQ
jgi:hypothetical protein